MIPTSRPIYKVQKLAIKPRKYAITRVSGNAIKVTYVDAEDLNDLWISNVDITDAVYEEGVYNTLKNTPIYGQKGGSIYYKQGANNITGLTYRSPAR